MANLSLKNVPQVIVESQVWKSIFRHGYAIEPPESFVSNHQQRLLSHPSHENQQIRHADALPLGCRDYHVLSFLNTHFYGRLC